MLKRVLVEEVTARRVVPAAYTRLLNEDLEGDLKRAASC